MRGAKSYIGVRFVLFLCFFIAISEISVFAQEVVEVSPTGIIGSRNNIVGIGAGFAPDYEGSEDMQVVPLLQFRYNFASGRYVGFLGNTLQVNLVPSKTWGFGPLLRYRGERDDVENDRVDRMKTVDAALELGAFLNYNIENWTFSISAAGDVADAHDGFVVDFGINYRFMLQNTNMLIVFAKGTYANEDYMDTYFGVDATDSARSGLPVYDADAEFKDVGIGALMQYNFNSRWGLLGVVKYTKLLGDASDSPLVDDEGDDNQLLGGVVVNYRF